MAWVRFSRRFSWPPLKNHHTVWKPDGPTKGAYSVTTTVAKHAIEEGAAARMKAPPKAIAADPAQLAVFDIPPPETPPPDA